MLHALKDDKFESFYQRIESLQYNGAIAIAGAIRGSSSETIYQESGLE